MGLVDIAENAGFHPLLQHEDAAARVALISHLAGEFGLLLQRHQIPRLGDAVRQRLLQVNGLSGQQASLAVEVMRVVRCGDNDAVDALAVLIEHLAEVGNKGHVRVGFAGLGGPTFMHVGKRGEVHAVVVLQALHGVPAFAAGSDEGDVELLIGSEDGTRKDLHTGEGSGCVAEEVTTVDH